MDNFVSELICNANFQNYAKSKIYNYFNTIYI